MLNHKRLLSLLSLLIAVIVLASTAQLAQAQTGPTLPGATLPAGAGAAVTELESLEIDLWPEYDRPSMLLIYRAVLPASAPVPATLTLRMPAAAGEPTVAYRDEGGQLFDLAYEAQTQGEWKLVTFTTPTPEVQFEYYDPGLAKDGSQRRFTYEWQGDLTVKALTMQVQQPIGATNMTITPSLGAGIPGEGGLVYYNAGVGEVKAGTTFKLDLAYQKDSDALSQSQLSVQPSAPITDETPGRANTNTIAIIIGAAGLLLLAGGGLWWWQTGRAGAGSAGAQRRRHAPARGTDATRNPAAGSDESGEAVYCHQCGSRANPGDVFCRTCGTRLR